MNNDTGCLIIHGFAGSVCEVEPLEKYISAGGIKTRCPKLKGHNGNKKDFVKSTKDDWIKSAEDEIILLRQECSKVILIGFSMGGLIAANLAMKYEVQGIVTLNTPIYYWNFKRMIANLVEDIRLKRIYYFRRYIEAMRVPIRALLNFQSLLWKSRPLFKEIRYPFLVCQGLKDDTVKLRSASYIYNTIASQQKEVRYYKHADHQICHSPDIDELCADVLGFVKEVALSSQEK